MLFRQNSNLSSRIRRTKSSSSVRGHHVFSSTSDSIDPEVARQHALAAAALAFERASSQDEGHDLSRRHSTCGYQEGYKTGLSRQRSVRFAGPTAVPKRQLTKHRDDAWLVRHDLASGPDQATSGRTVGTSNAPGEVATGAGGWEDAMYHSDMLYTPQDDVASAPSSYRRLRKSKSLSVQPKGFSGIHSSLLSSEGPSALSPAENGYRWRYPELKASKSNSAFSFTPDLPVMVASTGHNPDAVMMARQEYMERFDNMNLERPSSFFDESSARRQQMMLRKTVRTSADTKYGAAIASPNQVAPPAKKGLSARARSISVTIKSKLRRVFQRSSDRAETMPVQQLDASRPHFGDGDSMPYFSREESEPIVPSSPLDEQPLVNGPARVPSIHKVSPSMQLQSRAGSIHSAVSGSEAANDKSRVTSWTDSTAANTIAASHLADFNRLTSIQEHCDDPESPLYSANGLPRGIRYAAFRGPLEPNAAAAAGSDPIDTRRVYSALIKKLDENSPGERRQKDESAEESGQTQGSWTRASIPVRSSSMESQSTDTTVMRLAPGADRLVPRPGGNQLVPDHKAQEAFIPNLRLDRLSMSQWKNSQGSSPQLVTKDDNQLLIDQIYALNEGKSGRFARGADHAVISPIRLPRPLSKAREADEVLGIKAPSLRLAESSERPVEVQVGREPGSESDSNSMYSRGTAESQPVLAQQIMSPFRSAVGHNDGLVSYLRDSSPLRSDDRQESQQDPVHQSLGHLESSPMDAPGFGPVTLSPRRVRLRDSPSPRKMGHRREGAQVDETDVQIGSGGTAQRQLVGLHEIVKGWRSEKGSPRAQPSPLRELDNSVTNIIDLYQHRQLSSPGQSSRGIASSPLAVGTENERPPATDYSPSLGFTPETTSWRSPVRMNRDDSHDRHRSLDAFAEDDIFDDHEESFTDATNKFPVNRTATPLPGRLAQEGAKRLAADRLKRFSDHDVLGRNQPKSTFMRGQGRLGNQHSGSLFRGRPRQAEGGGMVNLLEKSRPAPFGRKPSLAPDAQKSDDSGGPAFI